MYVHVMKLMVGTLNLFKMEQILKLRQTYNVNVIGFRNEENGKLNTHFDPMNRLPNEGTILVVSDNRTLEKFDYLGYLK